MLESEWALRAELRIERTHPGYLFYGQAAAMRPPKPVEQVFEVLWQYPAAQVEYLIRNRLVNRYEAWLLLSILLDPERLPERGMKDPQYRDLARDFFWRVYPLLAGLDYAPDGRMRPAVERYAVAYRFGEPKKLTPSEQDRRWVNTGCQFILSNGATGSVLVKVPEGYEQKAIYDDHNTLDDLCRFLTQVAPETTPPVHYLDKRLSLLWRGGEFSVAGDAADSRGQARFTADELRRFYGRLKESKSPANVFYGRFGLLSLELRLKGGEQLDPRMLDEADQLLAFLAAHGWDGDFDKARHQFGEFLSREREEIIKGLAAPPSTPAKRHPLSAYPLSPDPTGRVRLEPIAGISANWLTLRRVSDTMDVMQTASGVSVMREKGVVKPIFATQGRNAIRSIAWDGENFWIGTATQGIAVVSPEGQVLDRVGTDQGLPPYNTQPMNTTYCRGTYLLLHAIEQGKSLAVGAFGPDKRLWFAVIQRSSGKEAAAPRIEVFHKATHAPPTLAGQPDNDLEEVFALAWLKEYAPPGRQTPRLLLVGRGRREPEPVSAGRQPLAIDLETLRVSLFPGRLPSSTMDSQDGVNMVWNNGRLFYGTNSAVDVFSPDKNGETWSHRKLVGYPADGNLLPWAGQIYTRVDTGIDSTRKRSRSSSLRMRKLRSGSQATPSRPISARSRGGEANCFRCGSSPRTSRSLARTFFTISSPPTAASGMPERSRPFRSLAAA